MMKIFFLLILNTIFTVAEASNKDWVKQFADGSHNWSSSQLQKFDASLFRNFNWVPGSNQTCEGLPINDSKCSLIETLPTSNQAQYIFNLLGELELLESPSVIKTFPNTLFKQVFKNKKVNCVEAGTLMKVNDNSNLCCTGTINPATNRCQLFDYVDVSVYTNRKISSAANELSSSVYFDDNGYIQNPMEVASFACKKKMCASGKLAQGIIISSLRTPGQESDFSSRKSRFMEGSFADDVNGLLSVYNAGLKINSHMYCIPNGSIGGMDIPVIQCDTDLSH